jgi:RNA recognition motif-containing protein
MSNLYNKTEYSRKVSPLASQVKSERLTCYETKTEMFYNRSSSGSHPTSIVLDKQSHMKAETEVSDPAEKPLSRIKLRVMKYVEAGYGVVFIKSLKKSTTCKTVGYTFSGYARVRHVQLPFNKKKGKNIGYGYVVFHSKKAAEYLVRKVQQVDIDGRTVSLRPFELSPADCAPITGTPPADPIILSIVLDDHAQPDARPEVKRTYASRLDTQAWTNNLLDSRSLQRIAACEKFNHATKPTDSSFFRADGTPRLNHQPSNLVFRVLKRA